LDLGRIIDTGRVAYYDPTPGKLLRKTRVAYAFEIAQAAGRADRIVGGCKAVYYKPEQEYRRVVCELEGVEAEAAAYMYRLLGFKPVRELADAVMATYDLPSELDLATTLNAEIPLTYYVFESPGVLRPRYSGAAIASAVKVEQASVPPSVVSVSKTESVSEEKTSEAGSIFSEKKAGTSGCDVSSITSDVEDSSGRSEDLEAWPMLMSALGRASTPPLEMGSLCEVPEASLGLVGRSVTFPRGLDSALEFMRSDNAAVKVDGLVWTDRVKLLALLVKRYNECAIEVIACGQVLMEYAKQIVEASTSAGVRAYFVGVLEKVTSADAEQVALFDMMEIVQCVGLSLVSMEDAGGMVELRVVGYRRSFDNALRSNKARGTGMRDELVEGLRTGALSQLSLAGPLENPGALLVEDGLSRRSKKKHRPRESSISESTVMELELKPPRWLGVKTVSFTKHPDGTMNRKVLFGNTLRGLTGKGGFEDTWVERA